MAMAGNDRSAAYKWLALALLWVAFFLQQGTRQVFSATLSSIQGSLGVTGAQIGRNAKNKPIFPDQKGRHELIMKMVAMLRSQWEEA